MRIPLCEFVCLVGVHGILVIAPRAENASDAIVGGVVPIRGVMKDGDRAAAIKCT